MLSANRPFHEVAPAALCTLGAAHPASSIAISKPAQLNGRHRQRSKPLRIGIMA
jgi:hypothetical protein